MNLKRGFRDLLIKNTFENAASIPSTKRSGRNGR